MGFFDFLYERKPTATRSSIQSCPYSASYVILDVETTGLSPYNDKIIQLSAIRYDPDGKPIDCYDTYLNPGCPIPASAFKVNHITDRMLKNAPSAESIKKDFLAFIGDDLLVGYNVLFDLKFLANTFHGAFDGRRYVDALTIVREVFYFPDYKLETVADCLGFSPSLGFHNSFSDCEAVATVLWHTGDLLDDWVREFYPSSPKAQRERQPSKPKVRPHFTAEELDTLKNHPLFGKNIVFTGTLSISREEAGQMAVNCGAIVKGTVSGKTDYLVVGQGDGMMSTKEINAFLLNQQGKANIKVICENEFWALLSQEIEK